MPDFKLRGLYAITEDNDDGDHLLRQAGEALNAGICALQYRNKSHDSHLRMEQSTRLLTLCRSAGVPLIINDDLGLAQATGADGIHLGRNDAGIEESRALLGPKAIIGVSCYNDFELALDAQQRGADYIAFGRFFPSITKPDAVQADLGLVHRGRRELRLPMVAIGGITPENGAALVSGGVDMLAVIQGIFGQKEIATACAGFNQLFADY